MSQLGMGIFLGSTWALAEHSFEKKDLFFKIIILCLHFPKEFTICAKKMKKKMKKNIATSIFGQYGQNLYLNMRKDFKYAQRPQAAFGRPKDPVAASGRLKILYDYISNTSKILLDTIWIMYSNCDKQKILEKVFFFLNTHPERRLP